jgi:hypothetical protein
VAASVVPFVFVAAELQPRLQLQLLNAKTQRRRDAEKNDERHSWLQRREATTRAAQGVSSSPAVTLRLCVSASLRLCVSASLRLCVSAFKAVAVALAPEWASREWRCAGTKRIRRRPPYTSRARAETPR